jgi:hypothetical protein
MKTSWPGRLTAPAISVIGGAGLAVAGGIAYGWTAAIFIAALSVAAAVGYYFWGGRDGDTAAMIGRRTDERQSLLRLRVQSLALVAGTVAGLVGYMVALAARTPSGRSCSSSASKPSPSRLPGRSTAAATRVNGRAATAAAGGGRSRWAEPLGLGAS